MGLYAIEVISLSILRLLGDLGQGVGEGQYVCSASARSVMAGALCGVAL
jgi:hypothetical protein